MNRVRWGRCVSRALYEVSVVFEGVSEQITFLRRAQPREVPQGPFDVVTLSFPSQGTEFTIPGEIWDAMVAFSTELDESLYGDDPYPEGE